MLNPCWSYAEQTQSVLKSIPKTLKRFQNFPCTAPVQMSRDSDFRLSVRSRQSTSLREYDFDLSKTVKRFPKLSLYGTRTNVTKQ